MISALFMGLPCVCIKPGGKGKGEAQGSIPRPLTLGGIKQTLGSLAEMLQDVKRGK
jgi:hypothetical protein